VEHHADADIADLDVLIKAVNARLNEQLLVSLDTRILPPGTIERIEVGKAKRVYDNRKLTAQ